MSYCRFEKDSDVYVYGSGYGILNIQVAYDRGGQSFSTKSLIALQETLKELETTGIRVPKRCYDRIEKELKRKPMARECGV